MLPPLTRLQILSELSLPPACAVPDALALIEQAVPSLGSMLLWGSETGEVAGAYSSLIGLEAGLSHYAEQFGNTEREQSISGRTFRDNLREQTRAHRFSDVLQIPEAEFRQTDIYLTMMEPYGIERVARVVVCHEGRPLGGLALFRGARKPDFNDRMLSRMEQAAPLLGALLARREDPSIAVIQTGPSGAALLSPDGELRDCTLVFRRHLAMLNQHAPGEAATRFAVELPESVVRYLARHEPGEQVFYLHNPWGRYRLTLQPFGERSDLSLVSQRLIPVNLHMFHQLQESDVSARQLQTACGLAEGASFADLAGRWGVSRHSVVTHAGNLYDKLDIANKDDLFTYYIWNTDCSVDG